MVLEQQNFRFFLSARLLLTIGWQIQSVAVGWQVYSLTGRALDLGYTGLAQFLPAIGLSLVAGHVADRYDRRWLFLICTAAIAVCSALLCAIALVPGARVAWIYTVLVLLGAARAFVGPAEQALLPDLVSRERFSNAVAWNSSTWQIASIAGPALGGLLYGVAHGAAVVYAVAFGLTLLAAGFILAIRAHGQGINRHGSSWARLLDGVRYVYVNKAILGSISLDLFAVLLGGAVALLPIYARDILKTGPWGLGLLRSAPAIGAAVMGLVLAHRPLNRRAGVVMLACVAIFGIATITFGLSKNLYLSLIALAVAGASDMVSVVIRATLVQLTTPPEMRGRVSAVNLVFIGTSNEFGEFESGLTAQWLGAVNSVVLGGVGTLLVVGIWALAFPALRKIDRITVEGSGQ